MSSIEWHVDEGLWSAYAAGRLDQVTEASIDAHVTTCAVCRTSARAVVEPEPLAALWHGISVDVGRPELTRWLRWLRRLGVREEDLVVLAASDGFVLPWATAIGSALACALMTGAITVHQDALFVLLAPLVPVLSVVAAFDATDDLRDLSRATAYSKLRLMLLRTTATLVVAVPATLLVGFGVPGLDALSGTWLLPALTLTGATLVLLTWLGAWSAAGVVAATWTVAVLVLEGTGDVSSLTAPLAQLALAALACAMSLALVVRTTSYRLLGGEG